jgi:hypothetical protein
MVIRGAPARVHESTTRYSRFDAVLREACALLELYRPQRWCQKRGIRIMTLRIDVPCGKIVGSTIVQDDKYILS